MRGNVSSILVLEPVLLMEVAERILCLSIVVRLEVECFLEAVAQTAFLSRKQLVLFHGHKTAGRALVHHNGGFFEVSHTFELVGEHGQVDRFGDLSFGQVL